MSSDALDCGSSRSADSWTRECAVRFSVAEAAHMYSVLFAFFIASQIHSQVTPFAPKDVEMRNPFEVQSGVQAWSCIHTMHLAGCLGFWYLEGVVGVQYAKYDLVFHFPCLS